MAARVLLLAVVVLSATAVPDQTYNEFLKFGEYTSYIQALGVKNASLIYMY